MKIISDIACVDYERPGHPERPQRVSDTLGRLRQEDELELTFVKPGAVDNDALSLVHPPHFVESLDSSADFDADTPAHEGILTHALRSVAGAMDAMDAALAGESAMSLLRPPGHHACAETAMGFCYLNQIAIAAVAAERDDLRVGVLDFDVHHGNGTEAILLGKEGLLYASAHQNPAYPGTGSVSRGNCKNYPVRPNAPRQEFFDATRHAFDEVMSFGPDLIAVSAGFDAYRGDPLAQENLEGEDYFTIGRSLRDCGVPVFSVLEGGYAEELPELVLEYVRGLSTTK